MGSTGRGLCAYSRTGDKASRPRYKSKTDGGSIGRSRIDGIHCSEHSPAPFHNEKYSVGSKQRNRRKVFFSGDAIQIQKATSTPRLLNT